MIGNVQLEFNVEMDIIIMKCVFQFRPNPKSLFQY